MEKKHHSGEIQLSEEERQKLAAHFPPLEAGFVRVICQLNLHPDGQVRFHILDEKQTRVEKIK